MGSKKPKANFLGSYCILQSWPDYSDPTVFVKTNPDIRLARCLKYDISHHGRDIRRVMQQYENNVKPMYNV